jgi:aminopeptidase N
MILRVSSANLTRAETARRKADIDVLSYRVSLDLRTALDSEAETFPSRTTIEFTSAGSGTWLDFLGAEVKGLTVNGSPAEIAFDGSRIALSGLAAGEVNTVSVDALGVYSNSGEGLHRFTDPADGNVYLYTQYEPADARRVFACFEQPDLKAPFTFELFVPEEWVALSNQKVAYAEGERRIFEPTLPISTYITAVIAGPYHGAHSDWSRGELTVPLGAYCRASLAEYFDSQDIFEITRQGLDFYAENFEYPYPWGKYDQVFVPEYNLGAMENPGCVTFNEHFVNRGAATESQYAQRAEVILHEMAHMWFGDLVTMKWWNDLWLKESFADLMGALASAEATRFSGAWVAFANRRKAWAYSQDQLPTTHPVVADIPDLEAAKLNFDGITYAKGAAVLKQLMAFTGRAAFRRGARRYFRAYAFGNTTLPDLIGALSEAAGRDLTSWSREWLRSTGVSTLWYADGAVMQTLPKPTRLVVGCYDRDERGDIRRTSRRELELKGERTPLDLPDADLVLVNDEDLTYGKIRLSATSLETARTSLDRVKDDMARALVWSAVWNAVRDSELKAGVYLDMAARFGTSEHDSTVKAGVLANAQFAIEHYLPKEQRADARRAWLDATWAAAQAARPGGSAQLALARAFAKIAALDDAKAGEIRQILDGAELLPGLPLDPDLRWALVGALAATGHASLEDLQAERDRDNTGTGAIAYLAAYTARPVAAVKVEAWDNLTQDPRLSNEQIDALITGLNTGPAAPDGDQSAPRYFAAIEPLWEERSIEIARRIVVGMFPETSQTAAADTWLAEHPDAPPALRRLIIEGRDNLSRDLDAQAYNG